MVSDTPQNEPKPKDDEPTRAPDANGPRGSGGVPSSLAIDPHHERQDLLILDQMIRNRWKIPPAATDALPKLLISFAVNKEKRDQVRLRATEAMISMDRVNLEAAKVLRATGEGAGFTGMTERFTPEALAYFRQNPEQWVIQVLGVDAWRDYPEACADQLALFHSIFQNRRTACKSGHKTGKTFILACAVLAWVSLYPESKVVTTAPTGRQVRELLWQEIRRLYRRAGERGYALGGTMFQQKYTLGPNWFAIGFATDEQHEGVQAQGWSGEYVLIIFDEGGGVPRSLWEVANTALQTPTSHMVAAGNPHDPATPFYEAVTSPLWHALTLSSWRSPNASTGETIVPGVASRQWCEEMKDRLGEGDPQYQFRVLGEFPDASSFALIRLSDCEAAQRRDPLTDGAKAGGCDVARFGDDKTVIVGMDGGHIEAMERLAGADVVDVAGRVASIYRRLGWESVAIDDTGVGGGVTDILNRETDLVVVPVNFGEAAFDPAKCANKATEMFVLLADDLKQGRLSGLPMADVVRELTTRLYGFTLKQQMQLEPKKQFKARIGRSPDEADALMLANYARRLAGGGAETMAQVFV